MKDLPPPGLDLFDLDEQFASERIKMAQLTNKCNDDEIEYFVKECGDIMGLSQQVASDDPKSILHYIFQEIVKTTPQFGKNIHQEADAHLAENRRKRGK